MYIYTHSVAPPTNVLSGLGAEDRYIPPKNVDPATGQSIPTARYPVPWGVAQVGLRGINCRFYHNSPRELVEGMSLPYTMEISLPGHNFIGSCSPDLNCPTEVHQNTSVKDPWRARRCSEWAVGIPERTAATVADPDFRANLTERVLDVAGIDASARSRVKPAEFLEVVVEREVRERPIKVMATLGIIGSVGILTFLYVRKYAKKRKAAQKASGAKERS